MSRNGFRTPPAPTKAQVAQKSALQRLDALEAAYTNTVDAINGVFSQMSQRIRLLEDMVSALVEAVGVDHVQGIIDQRNKDRQEERDNSLKALVEKSLESGDIVPTSEIDEDSLIVGVEKDAEGNSISGRAQLTYGEIAPDFQPQLKGKGIGVVVTTTPKGPNGEDLPPGTFEVLEIYKIVKKETVGAVETHADQVAVEE